MLWHKEVSSDAEVFEVRNHVSYSVGMVQMSRIAAVLRSLVSVKHISHHFADLAVAQWEGFNFETLLTGQGKAWNKHPHSSRQDLFVADETNMEDHSIDKKIAARATYSQHVFLLVRTYELQVFNRARGGGFKIHAVAEYYNPKPYTVPVQRCRRRWLASGTGIRVCGLWL